MAIVNIYTSVQDAIAQAGGSRKKWNNIDKRINASNRMFGMPHQLLPHNDPRLTTGMDLGRVFAQTFLLEAPTVCIKPGIPKFLPGKTKSEKQAYFSSVLSASGGNSSDLEAILTDETEDTIQLYEHKGAFKEYMASVNIMAQSMARFLGIDKVEVPWANCTFGNYNWMYYTLQVQNGDEDSQSVSWKSWFRNIASDTFDGSISDDQYVRFYVDAGANYSSSINNSTTTSFLEQFTEKLESGAKELSVLAGLGMGDDSKLKEATEASATGIADFVSSTLGSLPAGIGTLFDRLASGASQIIKGGNYILPEIWNDSSYDKSSYSFSVILSTPYGHPLAWYLNCGVPLCFLLGLGTPRHLTANSYRSPFLLKCFSPGWWNCRLGIVDNIGIEQGSDSWSAKGLSNEIKVSISIKDLYSNITIPRNMAEFMENPGMMEFLGTICGIDITEQALDLKFGLWVQLIENTIRNYVTSKPYEIKYAISESIQSKLKLFK